MYNDNVVVDVDAHFLETIEELATYLDSDDPWRERLEEAPDKLLPSNTPDHYRYGRIQRDEVGYLDEEMGLDAVPTTMEHVGLDKIILLSHRVISFTEIIADDRRATIFANTFTDFMLDKIVDPDSGIYTMVPAPYNDPDEAVELIDRVADEPGIVGVCMITAGAEPPLGNRRYDPIYDAAERADLPVVFHAGGSSLDGFHRKGYSRFIESHSLGFLENNMEQLTSIVIQGVPEKFPDLDIVFQESGTLWPASYMYRLDEEYLKRQSEAPLLEKLPSEYIKEFYFGTQPMEIPTDTEFLERSMRTIGVGQFMYASDYPHWDYDPPNIITDLPFLSEQEKKQILGETAEEVFGI
ncbi:amidohydrolase family protein [Saliphagus sp. GCM10025334]